MSGSMSGNFNTIDDFDLEDKTVLVRIDVNSPVDPGTIKITCQYN